MTDISGPIYHYTSEKALQGILESRTLWATDILYLNDGAEFSYALGVAKHVALLQFPTVTELGISPESLPKGIELLTSISQALEQLERYLYDVKPLIKIFVCSFSTIPDSLSQWRAYCSYGSGLCIGFDKEHLKAQAGKYGFEFQECLYVRQQQEQVVENILGLIRQQYDQASKPDHQGFTQPVLDEYVLKFLNELIKVAPRLKDPAFHEENEVRLVLIASNDVSNLGIKHRPGKSMMIPYIELRLAEEGELLRIPKLIVGPAPNLAMSKLSIQSFLISAKARGVVCSSVQASRVPYGLL